MPIIKPGIEGIGKLPDQYIVLYGIHAGLLYLVD